MLTHASEPERHQKTLRTINEASGRRGAEDLKGEQLLCPLARSRASGETAALGSDHPNQAGVGKVGPNHAAPERFLRERPVPSTLQPLVGKEENDRSICRFLLQRAREVWNSNWKTKKIGRAERGRRRGKAQRPFQILLFIVGGGRGVRIQSQSPPSPSGLSSRGGSWNWMLASMSRMAAISRFTPWLRFCPAPGSASPPARTSPWDGAEDRSVLRKPLSLLPRGLDLVYLRDFHGRPSHQGILGNYRGANAKPQQTICAYSQLQKGTSGQYGSPTPGPKYPAGAPRLL